MLEDLVGNKYGKLTVLKRFSIGKKYYAKCICECGGKISTRIDSLKMNKTLSCGCYNQEIRINTHIKHGMSNSRIYRIWEGIIQRCNNPKCGNYKYYGALGISLHHNWGSFENFYKDMKDGYQDNLTIDRINNDLGYFKENCRWATYKQQNRNTSTNISVVGVNMEGQLIEKFEILQDAQEKGFNPQMIRRVTKGKQKTHKGLFWKII